MREYWEGLLMGVAVMLLVIAISRIVDRPEGIPVKEAPCRPSE